MKVKRDLIVRIILYNFNICENEHTTRGGGNPLHLIIIHQLRVYEVGYHCDIYLEFI